MSESKQFKSLPVLTEASNERTSHVRPTIASVRVSPAQYLGAASVLTFVSVLLLRSNHDGWALLTISVAWLLIPILAFTDRIIFDGVQMRRRSPVSWLLRKRGLLLEDFEVVETSAVRTLRRGGSVRYRYRTEISGKGQTFVVASGGKSYRKFIRELLPLIHVDKLDTRSRDLRDYLNEPSFINRRRRASQLASIQILDSATNEIRVGGKGADRQLPSSPELMAQEMERSHLLRRLGNELRVSGRLREAGEAFRRALNVSPSGAWLIYDFARLLRSQASAQGDSRLLTRARAALRLASIRANDDLALLPLIGESLLECGDARQARHALQRVVDLDGGNFKARIGLADIALREGKLAHVIHHYHEAARVNSEEALIRYAKREADYYQLLNNDDDYLVTELRRISWLQNITRVRRLAARVTNAAILVALVGSFIDPLASSIGWSFATSSLVIWILTVLLARVLLNRAKPRSV